MKKIITLVLVLVLVFALAACGNKTDPASFGSEDSTSQPEGSQPSTSDSSSSSGETNTPESATAPSDSLDSVSDFLAVYGLTEDDVIPEHFMAFGDITTEGQSKPGDVDASAYLIIQADPEKTQEKHIKAWFEGLYSAMCSLSKDGKLHTNAITIGTDQDKEFTLDDLFTNPLWEKYPGTMWSYPCQLLGNDVNLSIATSYDIATGEYKIGFIAFGT